MFIMPTDEHEIKRITGDLLSTKSPGYDDISPKVVKATIDLILQYCVTFLTNHFFRIN